MSLSEDAMMDCWRQEMDKQTVSDLCSRRSASRVSLAFAGRQGFECSDDVRSQSTTAPDADSDSFDWLRSTGHHVSISESSVFGNFKSPAEDGASTQQPRSFSISFTEESIATALLSGGDLKCLLQDSLGGLRISFGLSWSSRGLLLSDEHLRLLQIHSFDLLRPLPCQMACL